MVARFGVDFRVVLFGFGVRLHYYGLVCVRVCFVS